MSSIVKFEHIGDFRKTTRFLNSLRKFRIDSILSVYGEKGCSLLSGNTPVDSGKTASSWSYEIINEQNMVGIVWKNDNYGSDGRTPVAILIQMGHGTRNGGYVPPNDYINPVMAPLFSEIEEAVFKVVTSL